MILLVDSQSHSWYPILERAELTRFLFKQVGVHISEEAGYVYTSLILGTCLTTARTYVRILMMTNSGCECEL